LVGFHLIRKVPITASSNVMFLAKRYGNPEQDLVDLIYSPELDEFTVRHPESVIGDVHLNEQIEEFLEVHRHWPFVSSWRVLHILRGLCPRWAKGVVGKEAAE
jgi:hypothetical protein